MGAVPGGAGMDKEGDVTSRKDRIEELESSESKTKKRPFSAIVYSNGNRSLDIQTLTRYCEALMRPHRETPANPRMSLQNHSSSLTTGGAFKYPFSSKY